MSIPMFDTEEWIAIRDEKFKEWFGDPSAEHFARIFSKSTELFDDMVDGDKQRTAEDVFHWMHSLWFELQFNEFWNTRKNFLIPVMLMAANAWMDANELEKGDLNDRVYSYSLRNLALQVFPMMVFVMYGQKRMREVSLDIHRFFTAHETLDDYLATKDKKYVYGR